MKRTLALLLGSALLVFALTACGCTATSQGDQGGPTGNDSAVLDSDNGESSATEGPGSNNGNEQPQNGDMQNPIEEGVNDVVDGIDNAMDHAAGPNDSTDNSSMTYDQMLNNDQVKNR